MQKEPRKQNLLRDSHNSNIHSDQKYESDGNQVLEAHIIGNLDPVELSVSTVFLQGSI